MQTAINVPKANIYKIQRKVISIEQKSLPLVILALVMAWFILLPGAHAGQNYAGSVEDEPRWGMEGEIIFPSFFADSANIQSELKFPNMAWPFEGSKWKGVGFSLGLMRFAKKYGIKIHYCDGGLGNKEQTLNVTANNWDYYYLVQSKFYRFGIELRRFIAEHFTKGESTWEDYDTFFRKQFYQANYLNYQTFYTMLNLDYFSGHINYDPHGLIYGGYPREPTSFREQYVSVSAGGVGEIQQRISHIGAITAKGGLIVGAVETSQVGYRFIGELGWALACLSFRAEWHYGNTPIDTNLSWVMTRIAIRITFIVW